MAATRKVFARAPEALLDAARKGLRLGPDIRESDVVRAALALAGGVDVAEYTPRQGRPRRKAQAA